MNTIGAASVFTGRDNSGEAAIVDSTQDNSFAQNILTQISQDAIRKAQKREADLKARKAALKPYEFDPLGQEEFDDEMMKGIDAYETFLADSWEKRQDPTDPSTEAGRQAIKIKRGLDRAYANGKAAQAQKELALKAGEQEGVDVAYTTEWIKGYDNAKPEKEGESIIQAKARYVEENPTFVKKAIGEFDFVAPIIPHIKYVEDVSGNKSVDRKLVEQRVREHLIMPEGTAIFNAVTEKTPMDAETFIQKETDRIMSTFPKDYAPRTKASSSSSSSSGGGSDFTARTTYSKDGNMYQGGGDNAIELGTKSGGKLPSRPITMPPKMV